MNPSEPSIPVVSKSNWMRTYAVVTAIITLILIVIVAVYLYQNRNKMTGKTVQNNSSQGFKNLTFAQKASARLSALTGIPEQKVEQAVIQSVTQPNSKNSKESSPLPPVIANSIVSKFPIPTMSVVSDTEAKQYDQNVVYRKDSIEVGPAAQKEKDILGYSSYMMANGESYTSESWNSANYNKYIVQSGNKLTQAYINTPIKNTEYAGGKYAIEQVYATPSYLATINKNTGENPEIYFLKSIIGDTTGMYKKVRDDTVNNRAVEVYEMATPAYTTMESKMMPPNSYDSSTAPSSKGAAELYLQSQKMYYYVDTANFEMVRTETLANNELVGRQTLVKSEAITGDATKGLFEFVAPAGVSLKSIVAPDYSQMMQSQFEKIATQYAVVYATPLSTKNNSAYLVQNQDQYSTLRMTTDFDPAYVPYTGYDDAKMLFSTSIGTISTEGYEKKPSDYNVTYGGTVQPPTITTITLDGVAIPAEKYTNEFNNSLVFLLKNIWYVIRSNPDYSAPSPANTSDMYTPRVAVELSSTFVRLTAAQGKVIDTRLNAEQKNMPMLQPGQLDSIPAPSRLLIGDATGDKLSANYVTKSSKTQDFCNTTTFTIDAYNLQQCLTEQYKGWMINYSIIYSQNPIAGLLKPMISPDESYYNITQSVLETSLTNIDFSILKVKNQYNPELLEKLTTETADGLTKLTFGSSENNTQNIFFFREINGKTVIVAVGGLYSNTSAQIEAVTVIAKKLILQAAQDKDLNVVQEQIKKNNSGFYPGMQTGFGV